MSPSQESSPFNAYGKPIVAACLALLCCYIPANAADGMKGFMLRVTAAQGEIKSGNRVLARVPQGTRLWCFEMKDGYQWALVKVPDGNEKGWLYSKQFEVLRYTEAELARFNEANADYIRYEQFEEQGKLPEAQKELEACLAELLTVDGPDHPNVANAIYSLGKLASARGDYVAAKNYYEQALAKWRKYFGDEDVSVARALTNLGIVAYYQGHYPDSQKYFEQALAMWRKLVGEDNPDTAATLNNLGNVLSEQGDYAAARAYHEQALAIRRKILGEEHRDFASSLNNLAALSEAQGDYPAARTYMEHSLKIQRKVLGNEHPETALTLCNLGLTCWRQADFKAADDYSKQALLVLRKVLGDEHPLVASTFHNLGVLARDQGDYAAARNYYEQALAIRRKILGDEHPDTAGTLNNLGNLAKDQGDYPAARQYYEQALAIYRKVWGEEHPDTARMLHNMGGLARDQGGNSTAARTYYEQALAIRRKVLGEEHPDTAATLHSLGALASDQRDYAAARTYYDQALAIRRKALVEEHPDTAGTLNNLGNLAKDQGEYATARTYYDETLAIYCKVLGKQHPDTAATLANLAWLAVDEENRSGAADYWQQARRALCIHESRVLPSLSQQEQVAFLENKHQRDWANCLSFALSQRNDSSIADLSVGWLINGKGVAQEALAEGALLQRPETAPLVAELRGVRNKLAQLIRQPAGDARDRQLKELEQRQQQLVRELGRLRGEDLTTDPWIATESIRQAIPAKSRLMNVVRFELWDFKAKKRGAAHYVAWLVPPAGAGQIAIVDLGDAEPIDVAVAALRKELDAAPAGDAQAAQRRWDEAAAGLAKLVWQPLAEQLGDAEELILSPDGALWLVPWGALPLADGKFLLENYQLRYVVSGRELVAQSKKTVPPTKSVVIANPDYDLQPGSASASPAPNLAAQRSLTRLDRAVRLPGTAREAEAIAPSIGRYAQAPPVVYLDREATEEQFKRLVHPRVLSIGTHGFFFDEQQAVVKDDGLARIGDEEMRPALTADGQLIENPLLRCGLLLAGCNRQEDADAAAVDDGVLTGLEIVGTDLRGTELVVLSACETGVGEIHAGEGVAGLRQAFQLAGAKTVLATLWQIPDDETVQLMNDFFVYLSQGRQPAEALRGAQLNRIRDHRAKHGAAHPYYWAAFTLTGGTE